MTSLPGFAAQKAVQALGGGVGKHRKRRETKPGRASRLALGAVFDGDSNHRLVFAAAPALATFFDAAHVAFVDLDDAAHSVAAVAVRHRLANLVLHQPRGLVGDADLLGQLHRRDASLIRSRIPWAASYAAVNRWR
jgi:hypothetical protein